MAKKNTEEKEKKVNKKEEKIDIEELKKDLTKYIDDTVKKSMMIELEKSYKRTIRDKNIKIIVKNMVITILLLIIVYLVYVLNDNNYFDKFFVEDTNATQVVKEIVNNNEESVEETKVEEKKEPTLDELKAEYAYLLDNIYVNENSTYVADYYNGKLTDDLKNYLTMNLMDIGSLVKEDNYNIIENDEFKQCYERKFVTTYNAKGFIYNGNNFRYISKLDSYVTDELVKKNNTNIKRVITGIVINDDNIVITTIEGLVKDNKIYNIISNEEIAEYKEENLLKNQDKLNKVVYTFDKEERLVNLGK